MNLLTVIKYKNEPHPIRSREDAIALATVMLEDDAPELYDIASQSGYRLADVRNSLWFRNTVVAYILGEL